MTEQLYGLRKSEYSAIGRVVRNSRKRTLPTPSTSTRDRARYRGIARVCLLDDAPIRYQPQTPRQCALFAYRPNGQQITLQLSGDSLEGDIVLTLNGVEIHVDCAANTAELRAALAAAGFSLPDVRATVFPGLWEFDFNGGVYSLSAPTLEADSFEPPDGDTVTPVYLGELDINREAWVSVTDDGSTFRTVRTVDWIPFESGAIKPGAIGAALWNFAAGWLVMAWQCRQFSLAIPEAPPEEGEP